MSLTKLHASKSYPRYHLSLHPQKCCWLQGVVGPETPVWPAPQADLAAHQRVRYFRPSQAVDDVRFLRIQLRDRWQ